MKIYFVNPDQVREPEYFESPYILSKADSVSTLEWKICDNETIPYGFMHLEHTINDIKVILTDTFQFDDIFSGKDAVNIDIIKHPIQGDILYKAVDLIKNKDTIGLIR
jgi:hypothetical protein